MGKEHGLLDMGPFPGAPLQPNACVDAFQRTEVIELRARLLLSATVSTYEHVPHCLLERLVAHPSRLLCQAPLWGSHLVRTPASLPARSPLPAFEPAVLLPAHHSAQPADDGACEASVGWQPVVARLRAQRCDQPASHAETDRSCGPTTAHGAGQAEGCELSASPVAIVRRPCSLSASAAPPPPLPPTLTPTPGAVTHPLALLPASQLCPTVLPLAWTLASLTTLLSTSPCPFT